MKEGLSDETKDRGPLYLSVYARASKGSHTCMTGACIALYSGLHTSHKNPIGLRRRVIMISGL
jgi:hypothetical protein